MLGFLLRRVVFGLVAIFGVLTASFFFWTWTYWPSTPAGHAYWVWLKGLVSGHSFTTGSLPPPDPAPLHEEELSRLWSYVCAPFGRTLLLLVVTLVLVVAVSVPLGLLAARFRGSVVDLGLRIASYGFWAVPGFLLGSFLQDALGALPFGGWGIHVLPTGGWAGECPHGMGIDYSTLHCPPAGHGWSHVGHVFLHLVLPATSLALGFIGLHARYLRNALIDTLGEPYVVVARSKGLTERSLLFRHALKNALVTYVPILISDLGLILGGAFAIDVVFHLGGVGEMFITALNLSVDALLPVDTNALQLVLMLAAGLVFLTSLVGEVALWSIDPRTRPD
jgi:peptide/nickel transport system permease protein